jgi:prevent-host-death family protein
MGVASTPASTWTATEAKARLGTVIERALTHGPQTITRRGRPAVQVIALPEPQPTKPREGTLSEFFARSPLRGSGIDIERIHDWPRDIDL